MTPEPGGKQRRRLRSILLFAPLVPIVPIVIGGCQEGAAGPSDAIVLPVDATLADASLADALPQRSPSGSCDGLDGVEPALIVRTVDAEGDAVGVDRVRWANAVLPDLFWVDNVRAAACLGGSGSPCAEWAIDGEDLPDRIVLTADVHRPGAVDGRPTCIWYATTMTQVGALRAPPRARQRIILHLSATALWCDDGIGFGPEGWQPFDVNGDDDCVVEPGATGARSTVRTVDATGAPTPAVSVAWYHPPESPAYDGEHPLACASSGCTLWRVTDALPGGTIYFAARSLGPMMPWFTVGDLSWSGYGATSVEDDGTSPREVVVTLSFAFGERGDPLP